MSLKNVVETCSEKERKKLNRRSKLFYVTCDYIDVNDPNEVADGNSGNMTSGLVLNVQSEPLNMFVNQDAAAKARKKKNRKSKLFYVSYDQIDVGNGSSAATVSILVEYHVATKLDTVM